MKEKNTHMAVIKRESGYIMYRDQYHLIYDLAVGLNRFIVWLILYID